MMKDLGLIAKLPRIVVAQAQRANPLYRSYLRNFESLEPIQAQKTLASAIQIGNPVSFEKAVRTLKQFNGIVEQATEEELTEAAALGDRTGMFNCPHTGVALAALIKLLKAGKIDKTDRVVVISTAHGLKFVEMKVKYHQRELEFPSRHRERADRIARTAGCSEGSAAQGAPDQRPVPYLNSVIFPNGKAHNITFHVSTEDSAVDENHGWIALFVIALLENTIHAAQLFPP